MLGQPFWWQLPRRPEHRERDRQVEARSLLPKSRRSEVDGNPTVERKLERRRDDPAANAMLRLLAGAVHHADDREPRDARLEVCLDLHPPWLEADERVSDRASEHAVTVRTKALPEGNAFVPNQLRAGQPV
jgi:hypothetical protein